MGQQPWPQFDMNPTIPSRSSGYHQKALVEIHNSLLPFAKSSGDIGGSSAASTISNLSTSGVSSTSGGNGTNKDFVQLRQCFSHLLSMGYSEVNLLLVLVRFILTLKPSIYRSILRSEYILKIVCEVTLFVVPINGQNEMLSVIKDQVFQYLQEYQLRTKMRLLQMTDLMQKSYPVRLIR
ncbi:hypothetical protein AMK59_1354 [Oryctes borbonicus]|uniref:Uncharacterized protein n=1 Tax=Oryctes borbonicus TaxID=1629725 RepID=A0A0T6BGH4_9SCAR|nr:hypothetical protein AMK59_1354 [Oryctes borbonicus]